MVREGNALSQQLEADAKDTRKEHEDYNYHDKHDPEQPEILVPEERKGSERDGRGPSIN